MQQARNPPYQPRQPENGHTGHSAGTQDEGEDPWDVKIGLAFGWFTQNPGCRKKGTLTMADGGGVRGYFSLLVLEDLMREIQRQEQLDGDIQHSFHPCDRPADFLGEDVPFLPCHYFDYIGGTSTGAYAVSSHLLCVWRLT